MISWDIKNSEILFKESNGITNLSHKDVLDLILLISDTTIVSKSICTKESPCYKGDIAFLLLAKVGYISISRDLGMQFDAQPRECTIPIGMLEWLEKNRIKIVQQLFDIYREKD